MLVFEMSPYPSVACLSGDRHHSIPPATVEMLIEEIPGSRVRFCSRVACLAEASGMPKCY